MNKINEIISEELNRLHEKIEFVRYGGLSSVKQTHYSADNENDYFHNPPKKRGLFAFPKGYVDKFLIGSTSEPSHVSGKSMWLKDYNGNKVSSEDFYEDDTYGEEIINPDWIKFLKRNDIQQKNVFSVHDEKTDTEYMAVLKKPRTFTYTGDIWHHLIDVVDENDVVDKNGEWIKTSYQTYENALKKTLHNLRGERFDDIKKVTPNISKINPYKRVGGFTPYTKDHLEVFIEKL